MKENEITPQIQQDMFKTLSLNIVAYLSTKGVKHEKITKVEDNTSFEFTRTVELENLLRAYRNNQELQSFITALRETKKLVVR
jgi:hypothetical protein